MPSNPATLNGRFGCHFLTQLALASVTKKDELTPNSLEKLATPKKSTHQCFFYPCLIVLFTVLLTVRGNNMDMLISANDLKVKGVTLIDSVVEENQSAIITVRGVEKYVVLKISDYNKIRELELDLAIQQSKADIEAGRFHIDGIEEHMKRVTNV